MVVRYIKIGKHFIVRFPKGSNLMVCFLIEDIINYHIPTQATSSPRAATLWWSIPEEHTKNSPANPPN